LLEFKYPPNQQLMKDIKQVAFVVQTIGHLQPHLLGSEAHLWLGAADRVQLSIHDPEARDVEEEVKG
jgi:hypothetical protein